MLGHSLRAHGGLPPTGAADFSAPFNPLGPPAWLAGLLQGAAPGSMARYPSHTLEGAREALASLHGGVESWMVIPTNGAAEALTLLLAALRPARIVVVEPTFGDTRLQAPAMGVEYEPVAMERAGQGFRIPLNSVCREARQGSLVMLSNPNNPTGHLEPPERLLELAECLEARGSLLVVDEAFIRLSDEPEASLAGRAPGNVIVVSSLTKDLALPGLRLGYLVAHDPRAAERLEAARQPWPLNSLAALAAEALALHRRELEAYLARARGIIRHSRTLLARGLEALGLEVYESRAPYILARHPGTPHPGLNSALHRRGFHVRDASSFHGLGPEYSRVSVRLPGEVEELLDALAEVLSELPPRPSKGAAGQPSQR